MTVGDLIQALIQLDVNASMPVKICFKNTPEAPLSDVQIDGHFVLLQSSGAVMPVMEIAFVPGVERQRFEQREPPVTRPATAEATQ